MAEIIWKSYVTQWGKGEGVGGSNHFVKTYYMGRGVHLVKNLLPNLWLAPKKNQRIESLLTYWKIQYKKKFGTLKKKLLKIAKYTVYGYWLVCWTKGVSFFFTSCSCFPLVAELSSQKLCVLEHL